MAVKIFDLPAKDKKPVVPPEPVEEDAAPLPEVDINKLAISLKKLYPDMFQPYSIRADEIGKEIQGLQSGIITLSEGTTREARVSELSTELETLSSPYQATMSALEEIASYANTNSDEFFEDIRRMGRNEDTETLLKAFNIPDKGIDQLFAAQPPRESNPLMITVYDNGVPVRKRGILDSSTNVAYDMEGNTIGIYNYLTQRIETKPKDNIFKETLDTLRYAWTTQVFEPMENFVIGVLPELIFPEPVPISERSKEQQQFYKDHPDIAAQVEWEIKATQEAKDTFRYLYNENHKDYDEWLKKHPDLVPSLAYQEGWTKKPELLKDPMYWSYEITNMLPYVATAIALSVLTGGSGPAYLLTSTAMMTAVEGTPLFEEAVAAGAPRDKAAMVAVTAGSVIAFLESAGDLPLLKQMSPLLFRKFTKEAGEQLVKRSVFETIKRFGMNFAKDELAEVTTEVLQEVVGNVAVGFFDKNRGVLDNLSAIAGKTAIGTSLFALGGATASINPDVRADIDARITEAKRQAGIAPERGAIGGEGPSAQSELDSLNKMRQDLIKEIPTLEGEARAKLEKELETVNFRIGQLQKVTPETEVTPIQGKITQLNTELDTIKNLRKITVEDKTLTVESQKLRKELYDASEKRINEDLSYWQGQLAIPKAEAGQPEAGLQKGMFGEEKEVRPQGKGKIVQISMEDQLKLDQARKAAEVAPAETKVAYEAQAKIEGIKVSQESDPIAQLRFQTGQRSVGEGEKRKVVPRMVSIDQLIDVKENEFAFDDSFTPAQAKAIKPDMVFSEANKLPNGRIRADAVLDDLAQKYTGGDINAFIDRVNQIRRDKLQVAELKDEIKNQMTEKPLETLPEPTPTEIAEVKQGWTDLGKRTQMTRKQVDALVGFFGDYINDPNTANAWQLTRELRRETLGQRVEELKARTQELIVAKGMNVEEASKQAIKDTLSGELPSLKTDYLEGITSELRDALFLKGYYELKDNPLEYTSFVTALTNALAGRPIPSVPGIKGGSALTRLQRVFGGLPKVLKAIEKMAEEKQPLDKVLEAIYRETGGDPIPVDQKTADYLRGLSTKTPYEPTMELPQQLVTPYDAPIEDAAKQIPLMPRPVLDNIVQILKQIGYSPIDIGNFLRANKASFDFSFWRQQAPLIAGHPIEFLQANVEAWNALWSQKSSEASWLKIIKDPTGLYQIYEECERQGGDFLRPLKLKKGTEQWRGTEEFGYITGERVIPKLTGKLPWVKLSSRAFETGTNVHNWLIFKSYYKAMLRLSEMYASGQKTLKVGEVFSIEKEMIDFSKSLANFTARGSLGKFSAAAPELSGLFFAPRAAVGRILIIKDLLNANPRVRLQAWRNATTFVGTVGGIILLGAAMGWWEYEDDPRSAEFMSIRIGNTRIDPWGGYRQFVTFFARAITGTGVSSVTGAEYKTDPLDLIQNFIRGKASPLASTILDFWKGKNFVGEEVDVNNPKQWVERIAPFAVWDIYEAYQDDPAIGLLAAVPAIVGAGVQTYTGDWKDNFVKLGLPKYSENLPYGITEPKYDAGDLWSDTASQFKGVDPESLTVAKGYPPYIKAMAEVWNIKKSVIDLIPNKSLVGLGTDFAKYRQIWLDRQKIVASGDETKLAEFDKDERTRDAYLGNITQTQFAMLNEYWSITDKNEQVVFLKNHPEMSVNLRDEWYKSHPRENAILALHGQIDLFSKEAYTIAINLAKEWDYPESALPAKIPSDPKILDLDFKYKEMLDTEGMGSGSAEVMLLRVDNPDYDAYRTDADIWGDSTLKPIEEWRIPIWRIDVQWRDKTKEYEAINSEARNPDTGRLLRDEYLARPDNTEFRIARRQRDFYSLRVPNPNDILRDKYTAYYEYPESGFFRKRWRLENPDLDAILTDPAIMGANPLSTLVKGEIPDRRFDDLYLEFQDLFEQYDSYENGRSPNYIPDEETRQKARETLLVRNPDFQQARWSRDGYLLLIGKETLVPDFVGWKVVEDKGKPKSQEIWFEDDWYLMEHPEFYKAMVQLYEDTNGEKGWKPEPASYWTKIPPRDVFEMWLVYDAITSTEFKSASEARKEYRRNHPRFDAWGVLYFNWTPIEGKGYTTPAEKAAQQFAKTKTEMDKLIAEMEAKLKALGLSNK